MKRWRDRLLDAMAAATINRLGRCLCAALELAIEIHAGIEPDYLEARDPEDLTPVTELNGRPVLVAVAARVGRARLIDNVLVEP